MVRYSCKLSFESYLSRLLQLFWYIFRTVSCNISCFICYLEFVAYCEVILVYFPSSFIIRLFYVSLYFNHIKDTWLKLVNILYNLWFKLYNMLTSPVSSVTISSILLYYFFIFVNFQAFHGQLVFRFFFSSWIPSELNITGMLGSSFSQSFIEAKFDYTRHACCDFQTRVFVCLAELSREIIAGVIHCMHNNEKKMQVGKEISVYFYYIKGYFLLETRLIET